MDYRNHDGSIAEMCGNGARVFARYLVDAGLEQRHGVQRSPRAAARARCAIEARRRASASTWASPPRRGCARCRWSARVGAGERRHRHLERHRGATCPTRTASCSSTTPSELAALDLTAAPEVAPAAVFPDGVNVEFVVRVGDADERHVRMRVHERGVGETLSCGTGAVRGRDGRRRRARRGAPSRDVAVHRRRSPGRNSALVDPSSRRHAPRAARPRASIVGPRRPSRLARPPHDADRARPSRRRRRPRLHRRGRPHRRRLGGGFMISSQAKAFAQGPRAARLGGLRASAAAACSATSTPTSSRRRSASGPPTSSARLGRRSRRRSPLDDARRRVRRGLPRLGPSALRRPRRRRPPRRAARVGRRRLRRRRSAAVRRLARGRAARRRRRPAQPAAARAARAPRRHAPRRRARQRALAAAGGARRPRRHGQRHVLRLGGAVRGRLRPRWSRAVPRPRRSPTGSMAPAYDVLGHDEREELLTLLRAASAAAFAPRVA